MDEYFLHFLWKFQKFNRLPLQTVDLQTVFVFHPGYAHDHSGPDFEEAKVKINDIEWNGPIEIHYKSSDWNAHGHQKNAAYDQVILHVVWIHDQEIFYADGRALPTLVLKDFVDENLEYNYRNYINQPKDILCSQADISQLSLLQMKDHALAERLEGRAQLLMSAAQNLKNDWEEVSYRQLTQNLGFSTNKSGFIRLSEILPYRVLKKHSNSPAQLEALIFGQSGFLEEPTDDYQMALLKEFEFLRVKHNLHTPMHKMQWMFLRLRPANFPTVRLAQLSACIQAYSNLFSWLLAVDVNDIKKKPHFPLSEYWKSHYDFGKKLSSGTNNLGLDSWHKIIINTAVPLQAAYSKATNNPDLYDRAIELLGQLKPENNKYTKKWSELAISIDNAFDSQALLHQYREYCMKKKCLQCNIGVNILKRG